MRYSFGVFSAIVTKVTAISGVNPNNGKTQLPFDDLTMFLYDLGNAPKVKRALNPVSYNSWIFRNGTPGPN